VFLETDVEFTQSASDQRKEATSGIGMLGIKFERRNFYGHARFTVFSKNTEISSEALDDEKLFGTNLLVPQNSSSNISNFSFLIGTRSFLNYDKIRKAEPTLSWRRFGGFILFKVNNTNWQKDSVGVPITINSFNFSVTYTILNLELKNQAKEKVRLILSTGYIGRRLGGDYGIEKNSDLRKHFIGTSALAFDGYNIGARLEIGKFFGQMDISTFPHEGNIEGFSGDHALITLGLKADINIEAKYTKGN
jgi:hypothetical protein